MSEVTLDKQVRMEQLADELAALAGAPVDLRGRHDPDGNPTAVAADVDQAVLEDAVDHHIPVWPPPPPDPLDVLADGVQAAATLEDLRGALSSLPDILRDLRDLRERRR